MIRYYFEIGQRLVTHWGWKSNESIDELVEHYAKDFETRSFLALCAIHQKLSEQRRATVPGLPALTRQVKRLADLIEQAHERATRSNPTLDKAAAIRKQRGKKGAKHVQP